MIVCSIVWMLMREENRDMIFCVEDDGEIRDLMIYTLHVAGWEAKGFTDGNGLFAALQAEKPCLILLDIMLPGEDGISILKKLRLQPATKEIPVIMATAKGTEYDKVTGLDLGADDYLAKPFGMMEMISRIRAVLRRANPRRSGKLLKMGKLELNPETCTVSVNQGRVQLTLKEYKRFPFIICALLIFSPIPISHETLRMSTLPCLAVAYWGYKSVNIFFHHTKANLIISFSSCNLC